MTLKSNIGPIVIGVILDLNATFSSFVHNMGQPGFVY